MSACIFRTRKGLRCKGKPVKGLSACQFHKHLLMRLSS